MTPIIEVKNLSKSYIISHRHSNDTFRDIVSDFARRPFSYFKENKANKENFWALKDINFSVNYGETIGIIGRNGAGKSTLLKILSQITYPTTGEIHLRGRVASLLEVGTGFHPELTGKENIYLNGAILGMKQAEIKKKFDEIVAFADIEKFLDTPVKRYSSGMYVRLAFAVAAHLEPEILIVDEVLAVGDAQFQKKCLGKMEDVSTKEGRTVLFVSHSMPSILRLCKRVLLLNEGHLVTDGPSNEVVSKYLATGTLSNAVRKWPDLEKSPGDEVVRLRSISIKNEAGKINNVIEINQPFTIEMTYQVIKAGYILTPVLRVTNQEGIIVFTSLNTEANWRKNPRFKGTYKSVITIPSNLLSEGTFIVLVSINTFNPIIKHVYERDALIFQIVDNLENESTRGDFGGDILGVIRPNLIWKTIGPEEFIT